MKYLILCLLALSACSTTPAVEKIELDKLHNGFTSLQQLNINNLTCDGTMEFKQNSHPLKPLNFKFKIYSEKETSTCKIFYNKSDYSDLKNPDHYLPTMMINGFSSFCLSYKRFYFESPMTMMNGYSSLKKEGKAIKAVVADTVLTYDTDLEYINAIGTGISSLTVKYEKLDKYNLPVNFKMQISNEKINTELNIQVEYTKNSEAPIPLTFKIFPKSENEKEKSAHVVTLKNCILM